MLASVPRVLFTSECYLGAMCASSTRAYAELWRGFYTAMPNADYDWAVALPATLQAAGLTEVESCGDVDLVVAGRHWPSYCGLTR